MKKLDRVKLEYLATLETLEECRCGGLPILWRCATKWCVTCPKCRARQFGESPIDAAGKWNGRMFYTVSAYRDITAAYCC